MENNLSQKLGVNNTLYRVAMKGLSLSSCMFIWTSNVCFYVNKFPSAASIYFHIQSDPGTKPEISDFMLQVPPQYKLKLVSCELSQKSVLLFSTLEDICAIDIYVFCDSFFSLLFFGVINIFVNFVCTSFRLVCVPVSSFF